MRSRGYRVVFPCTHTTIPGQFFPGLMIQFVKHQNNQNKNPSYSDNMYVTQSNLYHESSKTFRQRVHAQILSVPQPPRFFSFFPHLHISVEIGYCTTQASSLAAQYEQQFSRSSLVVVDSAVQSRAGFFVRHHPKSLIIPPLCTPLLQRTAPGINFPRTLAGSQQAWKKI